MYFSRETRSDFGESSCEITASQFPAFPALNSQSALLKKTIKLVFCKWDAYESLRHIVYRLWFACNWGMWIEINQTQQNCKIVHYGLQTEKKQMHVSTQSELPPAWRQTDKMTGTVSVVKQLLTDCEASSPPHLLSWTSGAVRGAEEASLILSLPVYNSCYVSLSVIMSFCRYSDCFHSKMLFKVCRWIFLRPLSLTGVR